MSRIEGGRSYDADAVKSKESIKVSPELLSLMLVPEDSNIANECNQLRENTQYNIASLLNDSCETSEKNLDQNSNAIKSLRVHIYLASKGINLSEYANKS